MPKTLNKPTHHIQLTSERDRQHHISKTVNRDDFPQSEHKHIEITDDKIIIEGTKELIQWFYTTLLQQKEDLTHNGNPKAGDIAEELANRIEHTVDITLTRPSEHLPEN